MKKRIGLPIWFCFLVAIFLMAPDVSADRFTLYGPGDLIPGSGQGAEDYEVYFPGMRYPVEKWPSYANSQVHRPLGTNGKGCVSSNYRYPWRDNFCETRGWPTPRCPTGRGHQGQDIRGSTCRDNYYWAVAAEDGDITHIGTYSVNLQGDSGFRHVYLHLHEDSIVVSDTNKRRVKKGDRIGRISDNFGTKCGGRDCTTYHLHYELRSAYIIYPPYMSLVRSYEALISNVVLMDTDFDGSHNIYQVYGRGGEDDEYLVGDWDGDGRDNLAYRRGSYIYMDTNFVGTYNRRQAYGNGNLEDEYLVGDWDGDGRGNLAVRRGNRIIMDYDFDGDHEQIQSYGSGNAEDEYLVGDWDGDGRDNIAVRRGNQILMDYNYDGRHDRLQRYGNGNLEDEYLVGDWDGDGRDNIAVRRGARIIMDYNFDGSHDRIQTYGNGDRETEYLSGNWGGDRRDNIAVRRWH